MDWFSPSRLEDDGAGYGRLGRSAGRQRVPTAGRESRWVQRIQDQQLGSVNVATTEFEAPARSLIQVTMKRCEDKLSCGVDRPVDERDEVKVTDARRVIASRE